MSFCVYAILLCLFFDLNIINKIYYIVSSSLLSINNYKSLICTYAVNGIKGKYEMYKKDFAVHV